MADEKTDEMTEEELAAQNGERSIADLAGEEVEEEVEEPQSPPIEGTTGQLSLDLGGEPPDISSAKLRAISNEVEGQYDRGEVVTFTVIARCGEVHFIDTVDAQGFVTKSERRHIFRVESIRRA
jgi:hypothetical protein